MKTASRAKNFLTNLAMPLNRTRSAATYAFSMVESSKIENDPWLYIWVMNQTEAFAAANPIIKHLLQHFLKAFITETSAQE